MILGKNSGTYHSTFSSAGTRRATLDGVMICGNVGIGSCASACSESASTVLLQEMDAREQQLDSDEAQNAIPLETCIDIPFKVRGNFISECALLDDYSSRSISGLKGNSKAGIKFECCLSPSCRIDQETQVGTVIYLRSTCFKERGRRRTKQCHSPRFFTV